MASPYTQQQVRKGVLHYLVGRGAAGVAGLLTVLLLVRFMDSANYAAYTALSGLVSLCGMLADLGMERVMSRYLPEGRLERSRSEISRLIWQVAALRLTAAGFLILPLLIFWPQVDHFLAVVDFQYMSLALPCFIAAEVMFQHFSSVLQALMMQKELTRLLVVQWGGRLLLITGLVLSATPITWQTSLWVFAIPELLGVLAFIVVIHRHLARLPAPLQEATGPWPPWKQIREFAIHNYGFALMAVPPQGAFMKILTAAYLPVDYVAAYGFFLSIAERARQYVPLHFFYSMLEPLMIASYLREKDFSRLSYRSQLLYKSNLLLMVPAIAWMSVAGDAVTGILTGGKFEGLSWILLVVMLQLTIGSHVVILQMMLNSLGQSVLLIRSSVWALAVMGGVVLIAITINPLLLLGAPLTFSLTMNTYIVVMLSRKGFAYRLSAKTLLSLGFSGITSAFLAYLLVGCFPVGQQPWLIAGLSLALVLLIYVLSLWVTRGVEKQEIATVRALLAREEPAPTTT